jgi:hypothetical protein
LQCECARIQQANNLFDLWESLRGRITNSAKKVATALAGAAAGMKLKGEKMLLEKQQ